MGDEIQQDHATEAHKRARRVWARRKTLKVRRPPTEEERSLAGAQGMDGVTRDRLLSHCTTSEDPAECWEWKGGRTGFGHGRFKYNGRLVSPHRLVWAMRNGAIPPGACVLHRCDNPACVNPDHLFLGSLAENNRDMAAKGRAAKGERNARALLTPDLVRRIRAERATGLSAKRIAAGIGASLGAVRCVLDGVTWRHVA